MSGNTNLKRSADLSPGDIVLHVKQLLTVVSIVKKHNAWRVTYMDSRDTRKLFIEIDRYDFEWWDVV